MRKTISVKFNWGDEVRLKTDPDAIRLITGITVRPSGKIYELAKGETTSWHQDIEIESVRKIKVKGFGKE